MNNKYIWFGVGFFSLAIVAFSSLFVYKAEASWNELFFGKEPDIPSILQNAKSNFSKEEFMTGRAEGIGYLRGYEEGKTVDPTLRSKAIEQLEKQEFELKRSTAVEGKQSLLAAWTEIGPNPIPNGQVSSGPQLPVSGRTIAISVHPTNPNIVYVGTAQGGLYRTTDGGTTWVPLMDNALSLAIGAIAISPSQPDTLYIGTGEGNFSVDSFFGVGVYRIENASSATPNIVGPLNKDAGNIDVFTGRSIAEIQVHPTDPNTIFVATTSGLGGIGGVQNNVLPSRGIYRSTNATTANPTFAKLTGLAANSNASVRDIIIDPVNANLLVCNIIIGGGTGGIYTSANALSATPTFTQTSVFNSTSTSELTAEFAVQRNVGDPNPTFYAATGNLGGRVLRSIDGGVTWTEQVDNNFCTPQCFYDIAIDVDPTNAARVYLGGSPALVIATSTNSGASFVNSSSGVHVDSHAIAVSPSSPSTVYFGSDGGIYKSTDSGASWTSLNNTTFRATQFMGLAVHPIDGNFTIGGTQDNGTNHFRSNRTWFRVDGGDGGYAVIDQNATDTTTVRMYHTYFNSGTLQGYSTTTSGVTPSWAFRGCQAAGVTGNGITCNGAVLFYAPLEQGPGNPNTVYYGTDRLYRSADNGTTHTVVSQNPIVAGVPLSAIGISRQDDNVRIVGSANGAIFGTTTGSATLTDLDAGNTIPNNFVARAVVDPNNVNTAYITLAAFGVANTVWKTTNLNAVSPTWTAASGSGLSALPAVPVSGFVVSAANSSRLYAGTDIGVYTSGDGGATWLPLGTGLPRVAVFDLEITSTQILRIATHGRGMWEYNLNASQGQKYVDFDGDGKTDISVFRPSVGEWYFQRSSNSVVNGAQFGSSTDKPIPGDYTGDGKTDLAFFRPSSGEWFILRSEDSSFFAFPFGVSTDIPTTGDFDGDGKADQAVFRPSNGVWYINRSTGGTTIQQFGTNGDRPVTADYDGDGKSDIAIFRPSVGEWYYLRSTDSQVRGAQFGSSSDKTVQGDYTGDGKADFAFFRPSTGSWFVLRSEDSSFFASPFGVSTDTPTIGDYDGDGKFDQAVFRPSNGVWYVNRSTAGLQIQQFGTGTDLPVPSYYLP